MNVARTCQKAELARKFGISKLSVLYILQQKDKIVAKYLGEPDSKRKSLKGPEKNREADEPLLTWFVNMRAINKELNNSIILQAAEKIAMRLGIEEDALKVERTPRNQTCETSWRIG